MNEKQREVYLIDLIEEISENIESAYQRILNDEEFVMPDFESIIKKRDITEKECEMVCSAFSQPFNEMHDLIEGNEELEKKYSFLSAEKRKSIVSVLDALVNSCLSVYTDTQPDFQDLKENIRKLAKDEKEEAQ